MSHMYVINVDGSYTHTELPDGYAGVGESSSDTSIEASEDIPSGSFVNIYSSSGAKMRLANATTASKPVHAFAGTETGSGSGSTPVSPGSIISGLSGLTPGAIYYLSTTAGQITTIPPSATGNLVQEIGVALSATEMIFAPKGGIEL